MREPRYATSSRGTTFPTMQTPVPNCTSPPARKYMRPNRRTDSGTLALPRRHICALKRAAASRGLRRTLSILRARLFGELRSLSMVLLLSRLLSKGVILSDAIDKANSFTPTHYRPSPIGIGFRFGSLLTRRLSCQDLEERPVQPSRCLHRHTSARIAAGLKVA